jgi:glutathione S-transferase
MYHLTALVTLLAVLVYFYSTILVSQARGKFGVKLPAISGNPDFERVFRAQMNTLEWTPIFLPSLWLFAFYISDAIAAVLGLVWVVGRILYVLGYAQAVAKRSRGFAIQALATIALWVGAFGAIVWRLVQA